MDEGRHIMGYPIPSKDVSYSVDPTEEINTIHTIQDKEIYDPRDKTFKASKNPALILLDLMVINRYEIPDSFINAIQVMADFCDLQGIEYKGLFEIDSDKPLTYPYRKD